MRAFFRLYLEKRGYGYSVRNAIRFAYKYARG